MNIRINNNFLNVNNFIKGGTNEPKIRKRKLDENKSQTESSDLIIYEDYIEVIGYHTFKISQNKIFDENRKLNDNKKKIITDIIINNSKDCNTIFDFGCAQGYYSFFSYFNGYSVKAFEHDNSYINNLNLIKKKFNFDRIEFINIKFGDVNSSLNADISLFLALIHWVYKCTDNMGSISKIINKLYNMTNKILVIEWIDPKILECMESYGKFYGDDVKIEEEYNLENFKKSLKIFEKYEVFDSWHESRKIYVCYKSIH